ncbi:MAG: M48 family metalloprotease, partial [bacterium]
NQQYGNQRGGRQRNSGVTLLIALAMAGFALFRYIGSAEKNPTTGVVQHVAGISAQQEIALGLQSAPQMVRQYGGESRDPVATQRVVRMGEWLVQNSLAAKSPYRYQFHLLGDPRTVNAFALPGGQIFITEALYRQLMTEGQLAGVLGHEIGHVIARHSAQQIAKQQLTQGLSGAAVMATYDPNNPSTMRNSAVIAMIGNLVNLKYGRNDEIEADKFGVRIIAEAGYDPRAMIGVMKVLEKAGGGGRTPDFFATHPNPENRIGNIENVIKEAFPKGVPPGLKP